MSSTANVSHTFSGSIIEAFTDELKVPFGALLGLARASGADFAEFFLERRRTFSANSQNKKVSAITPQFETGIGVRIRKGGENSYVSGSELSLLSAYRLLDRCLEISGLKIPRHSTLSPEINFSPFTDYATLLKKNSFGEALPSTHDICDLLLTMEVSLWEKVKSIESSGVSIFSDHQEIAILSSEGVFVRDIRLNELFTCSAFVMEQGNRCDVHTSRGATSKPGFVMSVDVESIADQLAKRSADQIHASFIEGGEYPVVLGNGFGGVIFHEACGHLLETTSVRKKSSPFTELKGQIIANSAVTAWDEGQSLNAYGSLSVDDEGMPSQKTLLIENGVLRNFLADRNGSLETGFPRTGSGRRQDYRFAPTSRMRNTYISPGNYSPEELIQSVDRGIYAGKLGGGSVEPTGEFNFAIRDAWLIEKGKLTKPLKGATVIGKGQDVLKDISMCANDLDLVPGTCGSESGQIWTTVGQPHIKVDRLTIGGR
jgi:TldD protein